MNVRADGEYQACDDVSVRPQDGYACVSDSALSLHYGHEYDVRLDEYVRVRE